MPRATAGEAPEVTAKRRRDLFLLALASAVLLVLLLAAAVTLRRWSAARSARSADATAAPAASESLPGARAGSLLDAVGADGMTPLMAAARANDVAAVEGLLRGGADPNRVDGRQGWTPLWHAIHKSSADAVAALLRGGADPNFSANPNLPTLLFAVEEGETGIVRQLLDAGADPRAANRDGVNALLLAVEGGFLGDLDRSGRLFGGCNDEMVRLLYERAPDLRLPPGLESRFAVAIARFHGCTETLRLLREHARG